MQQEVVSTLDRRLPEPLIESLQEWIESRHPGTEMVDVSFAEHSNDVAELRFDDGRTLMVKRGRYDWVEERFANSRAAADILREHALLKVPNPLDLPPDIDRSPLEAYWRIDLPTLAQLWPHIGHDARVRALRSWGSMLHRLHSIDLDGWGPLAGSDTHRSLGDYVESDLQNRLLPAVYGEWEEAGAAVEALLQRVPDLTAATRGRSPVLLHGDVHIGNILCEDGSGAPRCVGLLDLEAAASGLPESDLAIAQVLHGPLFEQTLPRAWDDALLDGYGVDPDPYALAFFRAMHLANLGFFSALVGDAEHAVGVRIALEREVERL